MSSSLCRKGMPETPKDSAELEIVGFFLAIDPPSRKNCERWLEFRGVGSVQSDHKIKSKTQSCVKC